MQIRFRDNFNIQSLKKVYKDNIDKVFVKFYDNKDNIEDT